MKDATYKVYKVEWVFPGGEYVPLDPVAGGNYHRDVYKSQLITAPSKEVAILAVRTAWPSAKSVKATFIFEHHKV